MPRPLDPEVGRAIIVAALELLTERGFAGTSVEAIAARAGVGKPAIYRRHADKAALAAAAISEHLPQLDIDDVGDSRAELWQGVESGFPADAVAYLGLIGGIAAEHERHPELLAAFRTHVLRPRRAAVLAAIERAQSREDLRADVDPVFALDLLAGPLLARAFAGEDTGPAWRRQAFDIWWELLS